MKPKRNPWPAGIIAAFALFIAGTAGLVVLASSHRLDLVSADYYEQEIRFQNQIDRVARTRELAADATVNYDEASRTLTISLPHDAASGTIAGRIHLYRPSAAGLDCDLKLELNSDGVQALDASQLQRG